MPLGLIPSARGKILTYHVSKQSNKIGTGCNEHFEENVHGNMIEIKVMALAGLSGQVIKSELNLGG